MSKKTKKRNAGLTLHPLKVNDALRVMLNTPPLKMESYSLNKQRRFVRNRIIELLKKSNDPISVDFIFNHVKSAYSWISKKSISNMLWLNADKVFFKTKYGWILREAKYRQCKFENRVIDFEENYRRCVHCGYSKKLYILKTSGLAKCANCGWQSTPVTGTPLGKCKIPVPKLVLAIRIYNESFGKITGHRMARMIKVTYKSAWFLKKRLDNLKPVRTVEFPTKFDAGSDELKDWNKGDISMFSRNPMFVSLDKSFIRQSFRKSDTRSLHDIICLNTAG